jgi:hypothetical protein
MGKSLNYLKRFSFGGYRTGLYNNDEVLTFSSFLSVIISGLFLIGLFAGISIYFNEIFIQRELQIYKQESKNFENSRLARYNLP